jgi:hypothetical protein
VKKLVRVSLLCNLILLALVLAVPANADQTDFFPFTHLTIGQKRYESMVIAVEGPPGLPGLAVRWLNCYDIRAKNLPARPKRSPNDQLERYLRYFSDSGVLGSAPRVD